MTTSTVCTVFGKYRSAQSTFFSAVFLSRHFLRWVRSFRSAGTTTNASTPKKAVSARVSARSSTILERLQSKTSLWSCFCLERIKESRSFVQREGKDLSVCRVCKVSCWRAVWWWEAVICWRQVWNNLSHGENVSSAVNYSFKNQNTIWNIWAILSTPFHVVDYIRMYLLILRQKRSLKTCCSNISISPHVQRPSMWSYIVNSPKALCTRTYTRT